LTGIEIENLRELGGLSVFNDYYFPFAKNFILEWDVRRNKKNNFLECVNERQSIRKCASVISSYENIVYISSNNRIKESPLFTIEIDKISYFIYKLD
jgi:hypothetical protein